MVPAIIFAFVSFFLNPLSITESVLFQSLTGHFLVHIFWLSLLTPVWHDRDKYIHLNEENIDPLIRHDFEKRIYGDPHFFAEGSVDTAHSPYDVSSAQSFEKEVKHCLFVFFNSKEIQF